MNTSLPLDETHVLLHIAYQSATNSYIFYCFLGIIQMVDMFHELNYFDGFARLFACLLPFLSSANIKSFT